MTRNPGRLRWIAGFLRPYRWRLLGLVVLTGLLSLLAMLPPLLYRAVINRVIVGGERNQLFLLGLFMVSVPVLRAICGYVQVLGVAFVGQTFVMRLRTDLYRHLLGLSMRFFGRNASGKLVNRLMADTAVVQNLLTVNSVQMLSDFISAAFAISVAFLLNARLALVLVLLIVLFVMNYRLNIRRIRRATRRYRAEEDRLAAGIQNRLTANLTVKTYGAEEREHAVFQEQSAANLGSVRESQTAVNTFTMNTMLLRDIGRATVYFLGCAMVLRGTATYGDVVAFTAYAMQLLMPAVRVSSLAQQVQDVLVSLDRIAEPFEETPEIVSPPNGHAVTRARGEIVFEHVSFEYEPGSPVLTDLSLRVAPGETLALVGPTGCGKTTILSLLLRFFDVTGGRILLDGVDLREWDLRALRRQYAIVLQETLLFNLTIAENIRYGRPQATREEIIRAARMAEIDAVIRRLPEGYDTVLGGHGVQLSVGERQRLSIARAFVADPPILIMDEATSALDTESERAIQRAMRRFLAHRTSFLVAHRLSTIRHADRILFLDGGRIVESGNHETLMRLPNGRYRALYLKHAGRGYIPDEAP